MRAFLAVVLAVVLLAGCGSQAPGSGSIPTTPPTVPYLFEGLHVDGEVVPGRWSEPAVSGGLWVAQRLDDGSWWWGADAVPHRIPGEVTGAGPAFGGRLLWYTGPGGAGRGRYGVREAKVDGRVLGERTYPLPEADSRDGGEGLNAVTSDGLAIVRRAEGDGRPSLLWNLVTGEVRDLPAPVMAMRDGPAGIVWTQDGNATAFLGTLGPDGRVTRTADLADVEGVVSPDGSRYLLNGEAMTGVDETDTGELGVFALDGTGEVRIPPPHGWWFEGIRWETEDLLLAVLGDPARQGDPESPQALARCSVAQHACALIEAEG